MDIQLFRVNTFRDKCEEIVINSCKDFLLMSKLLTTNHMLSTLKIKLTFKVQKTLNAEHFTLMQLLYFSTFGNLWLNNILN